MPAPDGAIEGLSKSVFEAVNVLAHAAFTVALTAHPLVGNAPPRTSLL